MIRTARTVRRAVLLAGALSIAILIIGSGGCGRTELDPGFADAGQPVGLGGSGGRAGAAGGAGVGGAAGAAGGAAGTGGATGGAGAGDPLPIACGQDVCTPGAESCCVQQNTRTCIASSASCGGFSISCLEGAACPGGTICCASLLGSATTCVQPTVCAFAGGFGLCTSNAQCPAGAPYCCRFGQTGVCSSRACP